MAISNPAADLAALSLSGNTAGVMAVVSTGTVVLAGGNNVTLSQNGQSVTVVAAGGTQSVQSNKFSAGSLSALRTDITFGNGNGVSFGLETNGVVTATVRTDYLTTAMASDRGSDFVQATAAFAGTNATGTIASNGVSVSVAPQSNQTVGLYASSNTTLTSSGTVDARSLTVRAVGSLTVGISASEILLSAPNALTTAMASNRGSDFVQANAVFHGTNASGTIASNAISVSVAAPGGGGLTNIKVSAGTLSAHRSDLTFANSNGISFGLETDGVITGTVQTNYLTSQSNQALSGSNGSFAFQTATFGNLNGLSFYTSNGSLVASYTVPTVTNSSITVSDAATSGTLARLAFTESNGLTLALSTGANGQHTVTGSYTVPTQSVQTQNFIAAIVSGANGNGTFTSGTLSIKAGNNVTLSTGANVFSIHAAGGGDGGGATMSYWDNGVFVAGVNGLASQNITAQTRSLFLFQLQPHGIAFPGHMTAQTARLLVSISAATGSVTGQHTFGISLGIYKVSGSNSAETLSLINSVGSTYTRTTNASSAIANSYSGVRWVTFHSSQWSAAPAFQPGEMYLGAYMVSWSGMTLGHFAPYGATRVSAGGSVVSGTFGAASGTATSRGLDAYAGGYTATTGAFPASIHISQLNKASNSLLFVPFVVFDNLNSVH